MPVNNFDAFIVDFQVFVYVSAWLVVEKELRASNLAHGRSLAGVFYFCEKQWCCRAVLIKLKISCVLCAQAEVSSSPESRDYANVFVFVASEPSCVLFTFHCAVLWKTKTQVYSRIIRNWKISHRHYSSLKLLKLAWTLAKKLSKKPFEG